MDSQGSTTLSKENIVQNKQDTMTSNYEVETVYPFDIFYDGQYVIRAELEGPELYPKYVNLFEKYGYSGNGYSWEGHITQILEKVNPELLSHIDFDPEAGAFFAYADTEQNQKKFVEILSPIFSDMSKLEKYLKQADKSRIDD